MVSTDDSILTSVKLGLGIPESQTAFDDVLVPYINMTFSKLNQLGCVKGGFSIEDSDSTWKDYLSDNEGLLAYVRPFIITQVRLVFDPPSSSSLETALEEYLAELEFRIEIETEDIDE